MAIWQFALHPVRAEDAGQLSRDGAGLGDLKLSRRERENLFLKLSAILPPGRPWDAEMRAWGDEKRNDISFFMSTSGVGGMEIRVDVSDLSVDFIDAISDLARKFGWVFVSETGEIVQPFRETILQAIDRSPAGAFVRDPVAFLNQVRGGSSPIG